MNRKQQQKPYNQPKKQGMNGGGGNGYKPAYKPKVIQNENKNEKVANEVVHNKYIYKSAHKDNSMEKVMLLILTNIPVLNGLEEGKLLELNAMDERKKVYMFVRMKKTACS